jgi:hypothetical protein
MVDGRQVASTLHRASGQPNGRAGVRRQCRLAPKSTDRCTHRAWKGQHLPARVTDPDSPTLDVQQRGATKFPQV